MFRRTVLPLAMLAIAFAAFASAAWCIADGNDFGALYFVVVALVALRAQHRIALAVAT
jgi:hypothetical protein